MFFTDRKLPKEQELGLYCTWIRQHERPRSRLVAVWIDPAMRCFKNDPAHEFSATGGALACEDRGNLALPTHSEGSGLWRPGGFAAALVEFGREVFGG